MDNCDKYNRKVLQYKSCKNNNLNNQDCMIPFVIFYKNTAMCPYSRDAFDILKKQNKSYKGYCVKDPMVQKDDKDKLIECLAKKSDETGFDKTHNTLPIIFHKGRFIGGYTELVTYLSS